MKPVKYPSVIFPTKPKGEESMNADIEELAWESILTINQWLDTIGCDRAYRKDMRETYRKTMPELEAQALATAKVVEEATLKRVGEVKAPEKWNEVYKRAFELSQKHILESLKQGKPEE